jgi:hypothetical protein
MSLLLAFIACAAQDPGAVELGGTVRSELYDFEIGIPKGWDAARPTGGALFRVTAPAGSLADGAAWLMHHDSNHPVTLDFLGETFRKRAAEQYPGFKSITERTVTAGGFPAQQMVFSATAKGEKELVFIHTVIQRQLQEYFILDVVSARRELDKARALSDRLLASFRSGLPAPKEREDRLARTAAYLKTAPARPGLAGTHWHELLVMDKKLGWQKTVLREAKVDGAPGWEFELELHQEDAEGGKRADISKGSFTADGSIQRVEFHRTVHTPKDPPVDVREKASLVKGEYQAVREFLDQRVEKKFKAPEGTILGDVADTMRRVVALAPPGKNALRVLEPFRDFAAVEEWENGGPGRIRLDGADQELIQAIVTSPRQESLEYLFDLGGALLRRKGARGLMVLRKCTEEQARKP